ncbi:MAG: tetratricopeptide repeat protein [Acidobacteriota bacterium]
MSIRVTVALFVLALASAASPARAQNREHLQLSADVRMLQEQISRLQLANNQLADQLKSTSKRLDDLSDANVKLFANQKVALDQALTNLATLREKMQDSDVRVSQLTQEMTAIRDGIRTLATQISTLVGLLQPPSASGAPATPDAPASAAGSSPSPSSGANTLSPVLQPSAGTIYTRAFGDYMSNRFDLAIEGFREVIQKYPDAPDAAQAQFQVGEAFYQQGKCREAIPEYQKLITTYKTSDHLAEAYYMQGICFLDLNQRPQAQRMFETVIKQFPNATQALMANQKLTTMGVKR